MKRVFRWGGVVVPLISLVGPLAEAQAQSGRDRVVCRVFDGDSKADDLKARESYRRVEVQAVQPGRDELRDHSEPDEPLPPEEIVPPFPPEPPSIPGLHRRVLLKPGVRHREEVETSREDRAPDPASVRTIKGDPATNAQRAEKALFEKLKAQVHQWLSEDGVPLNWELPSPLVKKMFVGDMQIEPYTLELGDKQVTTYIASREAEFSPGRKARILDVYHRQVAGHRFLKLGGVLGFTLAGLGLLAGYIRTDEATKGYYTNRLRVLAAAGLGAAGALAYRWLV